jgi:glycosyltransferase involved in cell wall biosynthesis
MRVSICVCTYNRAHILAYCIESLTNLKVPVGCEAEILVVDNNSVDNTKEVVLRYSLRSPIKIVYLYEPQKDLSVARNRAIEEACGDYLSFLDDDCAVSPDWLQILVDDIDELAPFIMGGPYIGALLPGNSPKWFKGDYFSNLPCCFKRGYHREFRASGCNMVLHRRVYDMHRFDKNFGMKGDELKLGEEVLLQDRFLNENAGAMVFYEPRIGVNHYILPHKISLSYCAKREMEGGAFRWGSAAVSFKLAQALAQLCVSPIGALFRDRKTYPY